MFSATSPTWKSSRRGQQRSLLHAGAMTAANWGEIKGTRTLRDWEGAADLTSRQKRLAGMKRHTSWSGRVKPEPLARGPRFEAIESRPETANWHEEKVRRVFASIDFGNRGEVRIDQLQDSFARIPLHMDEETFLKYAELLLPPDAENVTFDQFMAFHKAVWSNQPAAIRRHAGASFERDGQGLGATSEKEAAGEELPVDAAASPEGDLPVSPGAGFPTSPGGNKIRERLPTSPNAGLSLHKSSSVPSVVGSRDIYKTESEVRKAYALHTNGPYGRLDHQELQALILDLGLDTSIINVVEASVKKRGLGRGLSEGFRPLTFHEFIEFQNRYIASQEKIRADS